MSHLAVRTRCARAVLAQAALGMWLMLATAATGQDSVVAFDANGNLLLQKAASASPPEILGQPQNQIVVPGDPASFAVHVADTRGLSYQWRFNGTNLSGATSDALLLTNVSAANEGSYVVVLANGAGSVTSAPALLMIDSDTDGLPDSWEVGFFGNLNQTATGDFDGDGVSNLQEFLDGTNPTNSLSALYRLTILNDGGTVVEAPEQATYTNGQTVTLTASAADVGAFHAWTGDLLTRSNVITLTMTNNKTVFAHFNPMVFEWTNIASGDWNVASNWAPSLAPGSNDTVVIVAGGPTVTLNTDADLADFTFGDGVATPTLTGSGGLTIRGKFSWNSGNLGGTGKITVESGGTMVIASANNLFLSNRTLENGGAATWAGVGSLGLNNAVITNRAGASLEVQGSGSCLYAGGTNRFDNAGTFRKLSPGLTSFSLVTFNNYNLAQIQVGTLSLDGGGLNNGEIDVQGGTSLVLGAGPFSANATSIITGTGQFTVNGASGTLAGAINVSGTNAFSNGSVNLTGNYTCTNNTLAISGGTANFAGTGVVNPTVLNLSGGTLGGGQTVTVGNAMNWTGGDMAGSGGTVIPPGATLTITVPPISAFNLNGRILENGGSTLWTGSGNLNLNGAVITNRAGALFEVVGSGSMNYGGGAPRFDNAGTFRKSSGGTTRFSLVAFNNYGTVAIRNGIVAASGGYVSSANALLNCALGGTTPGTNYGQIQVSGPLTLSGGLSVDFTNGFIPALNDSFMVLTAGTRSGVFTSFAYPTNQVAMLISNTATSVVLEVTNVLTGPQPVVLSLQLLGSNALLTWTAVSNSNYRLEKNAEAGTTNWTAVPGDVTATSNSASKLDALAPSNRFYRVRVIP